MSRTTYWGLLTPEDNGVPEMFFRTEKWARDALDGLRSGLAAEHVERVRLVKVTVVIVTTEEVH
jgi:hypothetical protein